VGLKASPLQRLLISIISSAVVGVVTKFRTAVPARVFEMSKLALLVLAQSQTLTIACAYLAFVPPCSEIPAADVL
jgi:hypothetical protein